MNECTGTFWMKWYCRLGRDLVVSAVDTDLFEMTVDLAAIEN